MGFLHYSQFKNLSSPNQSDVRLIPQLLIDDVPPHGLDDALFLQSFLNEEILHGDEVLRDVVHGVLRDDALGLLYVLHGVKHHHDVHVLHYANVHDLQNVDVSLQNEVILLLG